MLGCLAGIAFGAWAIFSAAKLLLRFAGMALSAVLVPVCARYPLPFCFWVVPGWVGTALASLVVLLLLGPFLAYVPQVLGQAEVPQYEVLKRQVGQTEGVELREYPALNVVEVDAPGGTVKLSMSGAFGRLSSYCVGQNRDPARPGAKGTRIGMSGVRPRPAAPPPRRPAALRAARFAARAVGHGQEGEQGNVPKGGRRRRWFCAGSFAGRTAP